jgi:hypothetical protein
MSRIMNEPVQDAIGQALTDSTSIAFIYDDAANTISASVKEAWIQSLLGSGGVATETVYVFTWEEGTASKSITHNLDTRNISVDIYDQNYETVYIDLIDRDTNNSVLLNRSTSFVGGTWVVLLRK